MREILFRGKPIGVDNPDDASHAYWIEGSLVHQTKYYGDPVDRYHILYTGEFDGDYYDDVIVRPETVGQFTGLLDKNGKKIFEGDIVRDDDGDVEIVKFIKGSYYPFVQIYDHLWWDADECKIIGNIHDNPGLLKEGK